MKLLNAINAKLKDSLGFRLILFLCSILFIAIREPAMLLYPRLWAEEGSVFYQFALHHSVKSIFTTAHVGYLTLFNSIVSALQAKIFSVENAATVSTYLGFLVQLIPLYIIIFTTHKFWDSLLKKIICLNIVMVMMAPELWLNTTNSHFIFGLVTFFILILSTQQLSGIQKYFFRIFLVIGGLTGPASILFTPMFLVKAYYEKNREKYIQAIIISFCAFIQAIVIIYSLLYNNKYNRLSVHNFETTTYHFIVDNFSLNIHILSPLFNFLFGLIMAIFYVYLFIKNRKNTEYLIFLLSFILVAVFSTLGSLNMAGAPRYAYIPTCIFMMIIILEIFEQNSNQQKTQYFALIVLGGCLAINTVCYIPTMRWVYSPTFPKWKEEVSKWRTDTNYIPKIHPASKDVWQVKL